MAADPSPEAVKAMVAELTRLDREAPLVLKISAQDGFVLLSMLQLAWRHPALSPQMRQIVRDFGRQLEAAFAGFEKLREVAARGWDSGHDVPVGGGHV